mgnify:CR=1 FL=1
MDKRLLRDIIQWDVRTWQRALPLWQRQIDGTRPRKALAIGERDGGLSLWLASQGIEVLCTDLRELSPGTMELHARHGVKAMVTYGTEDATQLSLSDASVDLVIFKSVIGALGSKERQAAAIHEFHRVLRPGGLLLFAENLAGTRLHAWLRKRYVRWSTYWHYLRMPEDLDLFAPFERTVWYTTGLFANLGRNEGQRDLLARCEAWICKWTPASWNYMVYGASKKAG